MNLLHTFHLPSLTLALLTFIAGCSDNSQQQVTQQSTSTQSATVPVASPPPPADLVIRNGILLDMVSEEPSPRPVKGIVIRDGRIERILPVDSGETLPPAERTIDAGSKYILPGLIDSHVHFRTWLSDAIIWRRAGLYYGVTALFDTGPCSRGCEETGRDPNEWIAAYKQLMNVQYDAQGPTLYITGKKLDGPDGEVQPHAVRLNNLEEIIPTIDYLVGLGVDGIKVESSLPPSFRQKVMEEANARNLPVVGHSRDARESIATGMKFIEHMWPVTSSIAMSDPGRMFNSPNDDYLMDLDKAPELIRLMVAENVYLNPTMMGRYAHISERGAEFAEEDEMLLRFGGVFSDIPEELKPLTPAWMRRADKASPEAREKLLAGLQKVRTFIDLFDEAGGKVLAATDVNPPRLPGVTMHRELLMLVDSGIPPYRALLGATRWPAEMMYKASLIGTVEEGKQADILVLGSDPLADISNTRDITYVIRKGIIGRTPEDCSVITPPIAVTCEK